MSGADLFSNYMSSWRRQTPLPLSFISVNVELDREYSGCAWSEIVPTAGETNSNLFRRADVFRNSGLRINKCRWSAAVTTV